MKCAPLFVANKRLIKNCEIFVHVDCYSVRIRNVSVWPNRSGHVRLAVSVTELFGLETFQSDYEILQKSYIFTF